MRAYLHVNGCHSRLLTTIGSRSIWHCSTILLLRMSLRLLMTGRCAAAFIKTRQAFTLSGRCPRH